ncbi:uncharacterized protein LOC106757873 [Vigna radiata var. radiata]|uniref:Uncharacterized protein LOC106757873 n=1 Tax=Vigna radiata var. radiata TaxID=3916 RepID=A0A1S3TQY2_VIGRR|nr:uncharacterized protein LOC106757873 [Vigna radiata var. radiata]
MFVSEYVDCFKHLLKFNTMAVDEDWQCRKFENGLCGDIKLLVKGLRLREFPALVEMSREMEKTKREAEGYPSQQSQPLRVGGPIHSRGGSSSKKTPYSKSSSSSQSFGGSSQPSVQQSQPTSFGGLRCHGCGGPHFLSSCPQRASYQRCNRCHREGHYERDCPMGRRAVVQPQHAGRSQQRRAIRPQATGRVYVLTRAEATNSGDLIFCHCLLNGKSCCVLFDSGATHSFVSKSCAEESGLSVREL